MLEKEWINTLSLLREIGRSGMKIEFDGGDILLKLPKGIIADQSLIEQIKQEKARLIEYFKLFKSSAPKAYITDEIMGNTIDYLGGTFHEITPVQAYWMNNEIDTAYKESEETHGFMILVYDILGNADPLRMQQAVHQLYQRHESLRATFHHIDQKFYMHVNDSQVQEGIYLYKDLGSNQEDDKCIAGDFLNFKNHQFYLAEGPLFAVRLVRYGTDKFAMGIKIHHIIFDAWSKEVFLRDLIVLYKNNVATANPELPVLRFQFSDYLAFSNLYRQAEYEVQKVYWNNLYTTLPNELIIPGSAGKITPLSEKICKTEKIVFPGEVAEKINLLSAHFSSSRFIILHAAFTSFMYVLCGQGDLVLGSSIFGREDEEEYDQIGCFARTVLLRTCLYPNDKFSAIVQKVRKSNQDMHDYKAYPLMESMEQRLGTGELIYGKFWKINIQYFELDGGYLTNDVIARHLQATGLKWSLREEDEPEYCIPIDMQLNFLMEEKQLQLGLQYDSSLYKADYIQGFVSSYFNHILNISIDQ